MKTRVVKIINRFGLHSRAAAKVVSTCLRYQSTVTLVANGRRADGRHLVALLMLSASMGAQVSVEVRGPDEGKAVVAVTRLINSGFDEAE
jgi:phosphocarrier protein HPr